MKTPKFSFVEINPKNQTVTISYTNTNGYDQKEEIELERLTLWVNYELTNAWHNGYDVAKHEVRKALGLEKL